MLDYEMYTHGIVVKLVLRANVSQTRFDNKNQIQD